jgi:hypothetical protein
MATKIFEELPSRDNRPTSAGAERPGPTNMKEKMEKKVRQAVYDIRYRARREGMDIKQAYSQYMQNSSLNGQERNMVKAKIFGTGMREDYNIEEFASNSVAKALFKVFVEGVEEESVLDLQELKKGYAKNEIGRVDSQSGVGKYKVRVTDKNGTSYVRYATREKISDLRANPNIESVEMTGYGEPYEGERTKGERTAAAKAGRDYDGDGKVESGAKEYRGSVHNAIQRKSGGTPDGRDTSNVKEDLDFFEEGKNKDKNDRKFDVMRGNKNDKRIKLFPETTKVTEEVVSETSYSKFLNMIQEKTLTDAETAKKEEIAKALKSKYGKTPKTYAIATSVAKRVAEETACDSSEPQRDPRGDYAKTNLLKNKLRSALGVKNPIVMTSSEGDVKEDLQATVKSALDKGADFMKTNPVGKAASAVLAPVGTGRGTVTGAEQKRNVAKEEVEMIDERRREDKGTPRKPRDRAVEFLRSRNKGGMMTGSGKTIAQHEKERGVKKDRTSEVNPEPPANPPAKKLARKKAEAERQRASGREMQSSRFD